MVHGGSDEQLARPKSRRGRPCYPHRRWPAYTIGLDATPALPCCGDQIVSRSRELSSCKSSTDISPGCHHDVVGEQRDIAHSHIPDFNFGELGAPYRAPCHT